MYIDGTPVLHMDDDATHFSAAQFIEPLTTKFVWETILPSWEAVYIGLPNTLVFDDGSQFRDVFVEICEINDVKNKKSRTQHYSALGGGERYHEPIRRTFRKLQIDLPKLKKEFL